MTVAERYEFKAEIQQLLNILIHSLYTDRDIFLRELISNASDALNRFQFEQLTARDVRDPELPLQIKITPNEEAGTLTISDTGLGMTRDELVNNLGVIAHSGAKAFIQAMAEQKDNRTAQELIGQFGVGFYSAFMVADKIQVVTRSYRKEEEGAWSWESYGGDVFEIQPTEKETRGTDITLFLKEDAKELLQAWKLKEIIRQHSDYIAFPIYVGDDEKATNKQTAIWRQEPKEVTEEQYREFYHSLTFDFGGPLHTIHTRADVPLQFYALLYIPSSPDGGGMMGMRRDPGLKLYARKVLIQDRTTDLLPDYLQFVQGVVDSEDLPLSVSRENVQATRTIANLKKYLTGKVLGELKRLAKNDREKYLTLYNEFGRFLKQGLTLAPGDREDIEPLLFFRSTQSPETMRSLQEYVDGMVSNQTDIYYIVGDDQTSAARSPHLDAFRQRGIDVLFLTDPVDPVMLMGLSAFGDHTLRNVDEGDLDLSDIGELNEDAQKNTQEALPEADFGTLRARFERVLGDRVQGVREGKNLVGSPVRLVSDDANPGRQMFRINRMLDRDFQLPVKTLEVNPRHPLLHNLSQLLAQKQPAALVDTVIEQLFETALLQEGIHPDPASMAARLHLLMQAATGTPVDSLGLEESAEDVESASESTDSE